MNSTPALLCSDHHINHAYDKRTEPSVPTDSFTGLHNLFADPAASAAFRSAQANKDSSGKDLLPVVLIHDKDEPGNSVLKKAEGLGEISPSGVKQGYTSDCYFEAALASLANTDQGRLQIAQMIQTNTNQDGSVSYTVTFPGDKNKPVTVTTADMNLSVETNHGPEHAVDDHELPWARIIETAFLKHHDWLDVHNLTGSSSAGGEPMHLGGNDYPFIAFTLLTGKQPAMDQLSQWFLSRDDCYYDRTIGAEDPAKVRSDTIQALHNNEPVIAFAFELPTWKTTLPDGTTRIMDGKDAGPVATPHEYSVLGYDPATDTVTLRNPWGFNAKDNNLIPDGTVKDGVTFLNGGNLQMSFDTFYKYFDSVYLAGQDQKPKLEYRAHDEDNGATVYTVHSVMT